MSYKEMRKVTEKLWAKNKYSVMAKGYEHYKRIGKVLKEAQSVDELYEVYLMIFEAVHLPYTKKGMRTTLEHMWGYFRKRADEDEKRVFFASMNEILDGEEELSEEDISQLKSLVTNLLKKYPSDYIDQSYFIKPDEGWNVLFEGQDYEGITEEVYKKSIRE
ncbi:YbgA family protein [Alkalihalobacillus sp. R86527]|uniref:YbgA family protein n=1 Tax=Alkalihalobacillus sp. R86527 TaxID=3093863 RepID=UPI00367155B8